MLNNTYNSSVTCNHKDQNQSRHGKDGYKAKCTSPSRVTVIKEYSNCCCSIKRCFGVDLKCFYCCNGLIKVMAKAANFNSVLLTHEAQEIKLSNLFVGIFGLSFFTLMRSSIRSVWELNGQVSHIKTLVNLTVQYKNPYCKKYMQKITLSIKHSTITSTYFDLWRSLIIQQNPWWTAIPVMYRNFCSDQKDKALYHQFKYVIQWKNPVSSCVLQYNNQWSTYLGRIRNQQVLPHRMIPNLANSVEGNILLGVFPHN